MEEVGSNRTRETDGQIDRHSQKGRERRTDTDRVREREKERNEGVGDIEKGEGKAKLERKNMVSKYYKEATESKLRGW